MKAPEGMKLCAVRKKVAGYDFVIASGLKEEERKTYFFNRSHKSYRTYKTYRTKPSPIPDPWSLFYYISFSLTFAGDFSMVSKSAFRESSSLSLSWSSGTARAGSFFS